MLSQRIMNRTKLKVPVYVCCDLGVFFSFELIRSHKKIPRCRRLRNSLFRVIIFVLKTSGWLFSARGSLRPIPEFIPISHAAQLSHMICFFYFQVNGGEPRPLHERFLGGPRHCLHCPPPSPRILQNFHHVYLLLPAPRMMHQPGKPPVFILLNLSPVEYLHHGIQSNQQKHDREVRHRRPQLVMDSRTLLHSPSPSRPGAPLHQSMPTCSRLESIVATHS